MGKGFVNTPLCWDGGGQRIGGGVNNIAVKHQQNQNDVYK